MSEISEEKKYTAEYNIWGILFPLLLLIFSVTGGYYFQSIGISALALYLYIIAFSSAIALLIVTARLWGVKAAARQLEEAAKKETKKTQENFSE